MMCMFSVNERLKYESKSMQTYAGKCWGPINRNRDFTPSFPLSCFQLYFSLGSYTVSCFQVE